MLGTDTITSQNPDENIKHEFLIETASIITTATTSPTI
jgi:hypothetical protein